MQIKLFFIVFWTFFKITLVSFGGIYSVWALAEKELTTQLNIQEKNNPKENIFYISKTDFKKIISFSNLIPGPRASGFSLIGYKSGGGLLMLVVYLGLVLPGVIIIPIISKGYWYFFRYRFAKYFKEGANLAIIAILLIFCIGLLSSPQNEFLSRIFFFIIVAGTFIIRHFFKIHPLFLVMISAFAGYLYL